MIAEMKATLGMRILHRGECSAKFCCVLSSMYVSGWSEWPENEHWSMLNNRENTYKVRLLWLGSCMAKSSP